MMSFGSLANLLGIGMQFTPVLDFLSTLGLWLLNMIDAYVFDLGQLPGQSNAFG